MNVGLPSSDVRITHPYCSVTSIVVEYGIIKPVNYLNIVYHIHWLRRINEHDQFRTINDVREKAHRRLIAIHSRYENAICVGAIKRRTTVGLAMARI